MLRWRLPSIWLATTFSLHALLGFAESPTAAERLVSRYRQLVEQNPVDGVPMERLWKTASEAGMAAQVLDAYRKMETATGATILGHLLIKSGAAKEASEAFKSAMERDANDARPALALARLLASRGETEGSGTAFMAALARMQPNDKARVETWIEYGNLLASCGRLKEALENWEQATRARPDDRELKRRVAEAQAGARMNDAAIQTFRSLAAQSDPADRATALQRIARLHLAANQPEAAIAALFEARNLAVGGSWIWTDLTRQIVRMHQRLRTDEALRRNWDDEAQKNSKDLGAALQRVEAAEICGDLESALSALEQVIALVPGKAEFLERKGRLLTRLDRLTDAAAAFDAALRVQPGNLTLLLERAQLDVQMDDAAGAVRRIEGALAEMGGREESIRARILEFSKANRLTATVQRLLEDAARTGRDEPLKELATFYFGEHRLEEAKKTLMRMVPSKAPTLRQARALADVAVEFQKHGCLQEADECIGQAMQMGGEKREWLLLAADLAASRGDIAEAKSHLTKAYTASVAKEERMEADQRLLEVFRGARGNEQVNSVSQFENPRGGNPHSLLVEEFVNELTAHAAAVNSSEAWLRAAQWRLWNGDRRAARLPATNAARLAPNSPEPLEFLAKLVSGDGDTAYAMSYLDELVRINPAGRARYLREKARMELATRNPAGALRALNDALNDQPGDVELLTELAGAQERASAKEEALATWRTILSLVPGSKRRDATQAILRLLSSLGRHSEAAELLLQQLDATEDDREKFTQFADLLLLCQQQQMLFWLEQRMRDRLETRGGDYFSEMALGRVLKAVGRRVEAFETFAAAVFTAPDPAATLPELVREAEELRRYESSVKLQELLVRVQPTEDPDELVKLARMQERTGQVAASEKTWDRLLTKFPRRLESMQQGAEFAERWSDPEKTASILGRALQLDDAQPDKHLAMARMLSLRGDRKGAVAHWMRVVELTEPVGGNLVLPVRGSETFPQCVVTGQDLRGSGSVRTSWLGSSSGGSKPRSTIANFETLPTAAQLRLEAVWRLAEAGRQLPTNIGETETLWAQLFGGRASEALDSIEQMLPSLGSTGVDGYLYNCLSTADFARIRRWLTTSGRLMTELEQFGRALELYLGVRQPQIDLSWVKRFWGESGTGADWQAAEAFARRGQWTEAAWLGRRFVESLPSRQGPWALEVASWEAASGAPREGVVELLQLAARTPSERLFIRSENTLQTAASFEAVRRLEWLGVSRGNRLLPPEGASLGKILEEALLFGMRGERERARSLLDRVLALGPVSSAPGLGSPLLEQWLWRSEAAAQLTAWRLPWLAEHVWARTLEAPAAPLLIARPLGATGVERSGVGREGTAEQQLVEVLTTSRARAQSQWTALRFASREEEFGEEVLRTIRSKNLDASAAVEIGDGLKQIGAASGALRVYMAAWEAAPEDASVLRNLLDLARSTRDTDLLSAVLERCVKEKIQLSNDLTLREYGIELSQVLENNGDHAGAVDAVASGLDQFPGDQRLAQRLGQLYAKAGAWKEAERVIRQIVDQDPSNGGARQLLCMVYDRQGRYGDSAKLRLEAVPTTDSRVLAALYLAGREDDALAQLERLPVAQLISGTVELSEAALRRGNARLGQLALHLALARVTESGQRFTLKAALLPVTAKLNLAEEYGRLRQSLRSEAARKKSLWLHLLLQERRAALFTNRTATFSSELEAMASGQGPEGSRIPASILIIEEAVRQKNFDQAAVRLRETIAPDRCDWSDFGMVEGRVLKLEVPQLTAELYGERCRRNRADTGLMYEYARSLKAQKRFKEILAAFADTSWRAGEDALPAATHAHELMDLGAWDAARHWTERAWREGTLSQPGLTRSALARQALHRGDRAGAERWLRMAAKDRTLDDGRAFAEYLSTEPDVAQGMDWMRSIGCRPGLILATWRKLFTNAAEGDTVSRMAPLIKAAPHSLETAQAEALRTMAQRTGAWNELAEMVRLTPLAPLAETRAELLLLFSDAAKHAGNYALSADHALAAAQLAPMRWTCVTTAVEALRADGKPEQAAVVLDRYMLLVRDLERENAWALAVTLPSVPSNR